METVRRFLRRPLDRILTPFAKGLARCNVPPTAVTIAGTLIGVGAAALLATGRPQAAGAVYLVAGLADLLDGQIARLSKRVSAAGAFLDSTLDRISEGVVTAAVVYHFAAAGEALPAAAAALGLLASVLVSYARARAEALGIECRVGLVTRAERVVLLAFGLLLGLLAPAIYALLILSAFTVGQRIVLIVRVLRERE